MKRYFLMSEPNIDSSSYTRGNVVLDGLPTETRVAVLADVRIAGAESADLLLPDGAPIEAVFFPIRALISVTARLRDGSAFEVGTVGRQGAYGLEASFGVATAARAAICQIDGSYAVMSRDAFLRHMEREPTFRAAVQRAYAAHLFAVEQTVTCNVAHSLGERCARWLLTISHQVGLRVFRVRAEFLAMMLGQPEKRLAIGIGALADAGAISYEGEVVTIRDAGLLEDAACECYAMLRETWARLVEGGEGRPVSA